MTESSRLLSELESATIAGVSVETIRQFRGCGLLEPVKAEGEDRFREIDIKTLFYNRAKGATSPSGSSGAEGNDVVREDASKTRGSEASIFGESSSFGAPIASGRMGATDDHDEGNTTEQRSKGSPVGAAAQTTAPSAGSSAASEGRNGERPNAFVFTVGDNTAGARGFDIEATPVSHVSNGNSASAVLGAKEAEPLSEVHPSPGSAMHGSAMNGAAEQNTQARPPETSIGAKAGTSQASGSGVTGSSANGSNSEDTAGDVLSGIETAVDANSSSAQYADMLPVPSTMSTDHLIEMTKGLREQIEILREERTWLRARVEKLETRSEREQMLLLSESENIRKLIQQREQKVSWFRALPWLGSSKAPQKQR